MKPSALLLRALLLLTVLAVAASLWPPARTWWLAGSGLLAALALMDGFLAWREKAPVVRRTIAPHAAVGVESTVTLHLSSGLRRPLPAEVFDGLPPSVQSAQLPRRLIIPSRGFAEMDYTYRALERGPQVFGQTHLLLGSPLGLWQRERLVGEAQTVRVYPDFAPVIRYSLLAMQHSASQTGIVQKRKRGLSREFHQLREYYPGDSLSQIDWKATSKRMQLMSREYAEQRDQNVTFLLDCGRRMRAMDGELPQFDHCLNACLLLCHIALRQGDHLSIMGFGGTDRWLPPVRGAHSMNVLLNHLYDYQTAGIPGDIAEGAAKLMARQKRRALIVLLTNLRGEDAPELVPALRLMRRRHLVVVASLRERSLDDLRQSPLETLDDALAFGASGLYLRERAQVVERLRNEGAIMVDERADRLPVALANAYLEIKAAGRL